PVATRPPIWRLLLGPLPEDPREALALLPRADYILVNHAHYDHLIDAPAIALARGATLVGTRSACAFARSRGLPAERCIEVRGGEALRLGTFSVRVGRSVHAPILGFREPMAGVIPADAGRLWFWQFKLDGALSYHLSAGGGSVFFHPTSTFAPGEARGFDAETLVFGVTGDPPTPRRLAGLAAELPGVRLFLPTHYDNFFQPLSRGLALMPGLDPAALEAMVRSQMPQAAFAVLDHGQTVALP
ncbi:MAG: MBL fold metallo-hydrolase, partial [Elusimicrobia bacterium]|nr:MBL fold metallo-hydrolase [Elusimicrobiota bacterium]